MNVFIIHTSQLDGNVYAILTTDNLSHWLASFADRQAALAYCNANQYKISGEWCEVLGCKEHRRVQPWMY